MRTRLTTLGLTGGIATGKSTCCAIFRDLCPDVVVFDADASVARFYSDPQVIAEISSHFGPEVDNGQGGIIKPGYEQRLFRSPTAKNSLSIFFTLGCVRNVLHY